MTVRVNVCKDINHVGGPDDGYIAVAQEMTAMWQKAHSIEEVIQKFKTSYENKFKGMFTEELKFDYRIII